MSIRKNINEKNFFCGEGIYFFETKTSFVIRSVTYKKYIILFCCLVFKVKKTFVEKNSNLSITLVVFVYCSMKMKAL